MSIESNTPVKEPVNRKPRQKRTAVEKVAEGKAKVDARQSKPVAGQRICAARPSGPYGIDAKRKCTNPTRRPSAALCEQHEKVWRVEARRRAAEKAAAESTVTKPDEKVGATAAFASPELAATAKAKRAAQRAPASR